MPAAKCSAPATWHKACNLLRKPHTHHPFGGKENTVLLIVVLVLLILWALGFFVASIGNIIHALLVVALVVLIYQLVTGRRAV